MNVSSILNRFLAAVTPQTMHPARFQALLLTVESLLSCQACYVTAIGRNLKAKTSEKHCIKRVDRLLSNGNLARECTAIYHALMNRIVTQDHPIIWVDWSHADSNNKYCLLRASIICEGRALTLYQQTTSTAHYHCPQQQKHFLSILKAMLPETCRPVLVTDAGFKVPWFKQVRRLGWHYVGRVRGNAYIQKDGSDEMVTVKSLYKSQKRSCQLLGDITLTKSHEFKTHAVLIGKGHKLLKRDTNQKYKEPWFLVSSLPKHQNFLKKTIKIYSTRMQIELAFRDQKSARFGLSSELHRTVKPIRVKLLMLIAMLAHWFNILLGMTVEYMGKASSFQANTVKHKRVLSWHFLGMRQWQTKRFEIPIAEMKTALKWLAARQEELNWKTLELDSD